MQILIGIDGPRYTELTVMYQYWALFVIKWHYLGYFDVIRIQIWICEPDADFADFDQDGPRYTKLTVMYQYWALFALTWPDLGYFDVICIQIRICEPDADFDQDGPHMLLNLL